MENIINEVINQFLNEETNNRFNDFVVGKCYEYNDLNSDIQYDIDIQFKIYDESFESVGEKYDGFPEDYKYCFKYLNPNEIKDYLPMVSGILKTNMRYVKNLMLDIKKDGLQNPPVGQEGNHRGAVFFLLNKKMPYLEITEKSY